MGRYLLTSLRMALFTIILLGVIYPVVMWGLSQLIFPRQANGSLIRQGNAIRGSRLIGQSFTGAGYFHSRLSAAGVGYDTTASGGSNLGPTSKALHDRVQADVQRLRGENPGLTDIPIDMVTTSASGLDPDITPANAYAQVTRVAKARVLPEETIRRIVRQHITHRQFHLLGEPRVNVVLLNRDLDAVTALPSK